MTFVRFYFNCEVWSAIPTLSYAWPYPVNCTIRPIYIAYDAFRTGISPWKLSTTQPFGALCTKICSPSAGCRRASPSTRSDRPSQWTTNSDWRSKSGASLLSDSICRRRSRTPRSAKRVMGADRPLIGLAAWTVRRPPKKDWISNAFFAHFILQWNVDDKLGWLWLSLGTESFTLCVSVEKSGQIGGLVWKNEEKHASQWSIDWLVKTASWFDWLLTALHSSRPPDCSNRRCLLLLDRTEFLSDKETRKVWNFMRRSQSSPLIYLSE